jgi:hypothetical protein
MNHLYTPPDAMSGAFDDRGAPALHREGLIGLPGDIITHEQLNHWARI